MEDIVLPYNSTIDTHGFDGCNIQETTIKVDDKIIQNFYATNNNYYYIVCTQNTLTLDD